MQKMATVGCALAGQQQKCGGHMPCNSWHNWGKHDALATARLVCLIISRGIGHIAAGSYERKEEVARSMHRCRWYQQKH